MWAIFVSHSYIVITDNRQQAHIAPWALEHFKDALDDSIDFVKKSKKRSDKAEKLYG